jgi:hypothetical protein
MMRRLRATVLLLLLLPAAQAAAHKPSDSYLKITSRAGRLEIQWDIALKDLEFLVGLDRDDNGEITWREVRARRAAIEAHVLQRLRIAADDTPCTLQSLDLLASRHSDGGYAVLMLEADGAGGSDALTVAYSLLFDADPTHRGLVLFTKGDVASTHVLSVDAPTLVLDAAGASLWTSFVAFVRVGVWHILIGFDHILFLATLLLPAVFEWRDRTWRPVTNLRSTFASVFKVVSMFTLAHSITLWLAVMGYVTLPSRLVEASIALSIVITAANNLYPVLPLSSWAIAFLFGLVHGFGFANVLLDLGLTSSSLALSLLGFNVGVELGQVAIVLAFLPLAFLVRDTAFYRRTVFGFGSVAVGVVGGLWTVERLLNVRILGV